MYLQSYLYKYYTIDSASSSYIYKQLSSEKTFASKEFTEVVGWLAVAKTPMGPLSAGEQISWPRPSMIRWACNELVRSDAEAWGCSAILSKDIIGWLAGNASLKHVPL